MNILFIFVQPAIVYHDEESKQRYMVPALHRNVNHACMKTTAFANPCPVHYLHYKSKHKTYIYPLSGNFFSFLSEIKVFSFWNISSKHPSHSSLKMTLAKNQSVYQNLQIRYWLIPFQIFAYSHGVYSLSYLQYSFIHLFIHIILLCQVHIYIQWK